MGLSTLILALLHRSILGFQFQMMKVMRKTMSQQLSLVKSLVQLILQIFHSISLGMDNNNHHLVFYIDRCFDLGFVLQDSIQEHMNMHIFQDSNILVASNIVYTGTSSHKLDNPAKHEDSCNHICLDIHIGKFLCYSNLSVNFGNDNNFFDLELPNSKFGQDNIHRQLL